MEEEFIPYEEALALKELGFHSSYSLGGTNQGSIFYYKNGKLQYDYYPIYSPTAEEGQIDAPLYQQAFRWFRDKHKIYPRVIPNDDHNILKWSFCFDDISFKEGFVKYIKPEIVRNHYDSYKKAELECLRNLIEIVKTKPHIEK